MSDNQLAVLAGRGDSGAFQTLFERYQHPVYNFVYRMVDNAEDAADIVQNTFIRMYTVLGEKQPDNFSAYLYRMARNLAYDEMRRRQRYADVDQELLVPEDPNIYADPHRALMLGEQIDGVRRAVRNLGENQRAALILRELQDLDYDTMAEVLDSNRNAVGALLSRARLKLREELRMAQIQTQEIPSECEEVISRLSPYIDGELPEPDALRIEGHVAECTFCAAALEEMREASRSFRMLIPVVPPIDIAQAVNGHLQGLSGQGGAGGGTETAGLDGAGGAEGGMAPAAGAGGGFGGAGGGAEGGSKGAGGKKIMILLGVASLIFFGIGAWLLADNDGDGGEPPPDATVPAVIGTTTVKTTSRTEPAVAPDTITPAPEEQITVTPQPEEPPAETPVDPVPGETPTAPGDQYGVDGSGGSGGSGIMVPTPVRPVTPRID